MSKLEQLINELCPNGVEYKTIQSFSQLLKGMSGVSNKWSNDGNCRFIEYKNAYDNLKIDVTRLPFATVKKIDNQIELKQGDILFTSASETPDECAISSVIEDEIAEGIFMDDHLFGIRVNDKTRYNAAFLNYYFRSDSFRRIVNKTVRGVTRYYISIPNFIKLQIPIPPLPVQEEIVHILDNFTELTAELTTELTARKQQYEYYRDSILTYDESIKIELGQIATVTKLAGFEFTKYVSYSDSGKVIALRGLNVKNGHLDLKDVKYIDNSDLSKLTRSKLHIGDMLFTYVGTIGQVALVNEEDRFYLAPNVALIRTTTDKLMPKFMRYYFQSSQFWKTQIDRLLQSSSMQNIPMGKIRKFKIPVPPLAEQQRIVDILDRFDKLCNDIGEGLPAEIEARQKQYEYYRDKLLKFKKKEAVENE